jgi:hypothetical protein
VGLLWRRRAARAGNPYAQRLLEGGGAPSSSSAAQAVRGADIRVEDAGDGSAAAAAAGMAEGPALTISADVVASFWEELLPVRQAFPHIGCGPF